MRAFLWIYCLVASIFWEAIFDLLDLCAWLLFKLVGFTERRIARISEIVNEHFSD